MRSSAAFAFVALFAATATPAEPGKSERGGKPEQAGKPAEPGAKAAERAKPAQPGQPSTKQGDEARDKAHEDRAKRGKSEEAHAAAPGQNKEERGEAQEQTREKRSKQHRDALEGKYGADVLQRPPVLAELKTHAWRMARLERLRALAEAQSDTAKRNQNVARLTKLTAREIARHERQMDQLKGQGEQGSEKRAEKAGGAQ
jgi:hypothetical protein